MKRALSLILILLLFGCGYGIRNSSHLPFSDIMISSIANKTFEPNIEDILYRKLADEFHRQGIRLRNTSQFVLSGEITSFKLRILSEKNEFASEYEVVITADFTITGPDGFSEKFLSESSPFIESFVAEKRDINVIVSLKEIATERSLELLANRLVAEVIYR